MTARRLVAILGPSPVTLVCGDCRAELEALGATVDTSPRSVTPGHRCETHPAATRHISQAMHAVRASIEVLSRHAASNAETRPELPAPLDDAAVALVATMAATLIAAHVQAGDAMGEDLIVVSVRNARRVLEVAKGGM